MPFSLLETLTTTTTKINSPLEISQIQASRLFQLVPSKLPNTPRSPLLSSLYMKATSCSPLGSPCPHLQIFSGLSLTQVQFPAFFIKPILHLLSFFVIFRLWISSLMKFHSSSVSIETRSPPWLWHLFLFQCQENLFTEIMYQEFLKVISGHSKKW